MNFIEMLLARTLISRNLGEDWWKAASVELDAWVKNLPLAAPKKHPLSAFMTPTAWGERELQAETYGRLIGFAADLLDCIDHPESNFESKLVELRSPSFFETSSEIHTASMFIRKGMRTEFITSSKKEKRPDLEVNYQGTGILVECKVRSGLSVEERGSDEIYRKKMRSRIDSAESLLKNASDKVPNPTTPYIVALSIEHPSANLFSLEQKLLRSRSEEFLIRHPNVTAIILCDEEPPHREDDKTKISTHLGIVVSQNSDYRLPTEFYQITVDRRIDTRPKFEVLTTYWAYAPADEVTKATLESCELPDYDIVQNVECENCHTLFGVYWHNEVLEKKRLLELKELAYLKERYFTYGIAMNQLVHSLEGMAMKTLHSAIKKEQTTAEAKAEVMILKKFNDWAVEFMEERIATLDLSPSERKKIDREMATRVGQFMEDCFKHIEKLSDEWEKTDEYAKLDAERKGKALPESVPTEAV